MCRFLKSETLIIISSNGNCPNLPPNPRNISLYILDIILKTDGTDEE